MILAIDVGNTHIVFGIFDNTKLVASWRMATHKEQTEDEYGIMLKSMLKDEDIDIKKIRGAVISSVVPTVTPILEIMCRKYIDSRAIVVGPGIKTGINIKYENPREVGGDRIVNVVAACHKYGGPIIIVDFGTATTFDAVTENFDYLGGAIAPGIGISSEALFRSASRLYRVEIVKPDKVIGRNTATSMQAGIFYGYVGLVDSIVERMKKEMGGGKITTVATGGLASLICSETKTVDYVDHMLTLEGLRLLYERNIE